ncbi:MAG: hypothetical protein CR982_05120 [Candidatus Cloacimonadota bacterium]|nr:MAG: hypothetical protein CR982_05120 [Candidatus Cloacimonadota bacterium]PIE78800.1 MAG: hypothetical protein CSA15_06005 [Candidatus Delongbacteria bacterium]
MFRFFILFLFLVISCGDQLVKDNHKHKSVFKGNNGDSFYAEKKDGLVKFRLVKKGEALLFSENSITSQHITSVPAKAFIQVIKDQLGNLIHVRVPNNKRGYVEGYIKKSYLFDKEFYGEPLMLSEYEISRLKEIERKRELRRLEKERKDNAKIREERKSRAYAKIGSDTKNVIGMNYSSTSKYLRKNGFKEDLSYAENATKTIKFKKGNNLFYATLHNGSIVGFSIINNVDGFDEGELDVMLLNYVGEIFYDVEEEYKINDNIVKYFSKTEKKRVPIVIKDDNSKPKSTIEIIVGQFSGIE